ncbi:complement C3-like isoform X2 [Pseudochaenichthys georgianus]|uniref:complement C3-like isoform X2 n=1 Tax=Pseudochaenichthys georgianus TaxID=52239 RepID=UPI00146AC390|nr:complement C3-like isoform X2 [Pseudochaenichthys georgianus]
MCICTLSSLTDCLRRLSWSPFSLGISSSKLTRPSTPPIAETPEGIILPLYGVSWISGIHSGKYQLGELVSLGLWKIVTRFRRNPQQSFQAEFEVKEYVLPSIEVKLNPTRAFFFVDDQELTVNIKATYLFGEEVNGMAYVVFGVIHDGQKRSFPSSLQRVQIERGVGAVTLRREHITTTIGNIEELVTKSIFVAVSVLTENGDEMVEAELRNIQIVKSPYTIHFKKTPKYFKPGMTFEVVVEVVNPDNTPAQGVAVVVEPGTVNGFTANNGMARLTINTRDPQLTITAKTNDPRISSSRQASATMRALPYITESKNYIHIGVDSADVELGHNLKITFNLIMRESHDCDITYLFMSRGQLVLKGRYKTRGQVLISLMVFITKDMLPSFRIIAYYHTNGNEVVSDSVWVDVKDSCMGSLKLEPSRPFPSYGPRKMFGLKVTGDPGAIVGLVAVDKGVYVLNNKHRLTQKRVWDVVEKHDTGCTPGGGKNGMSVFYDAGLLFESNTASGTPHRQELKCPAPSRRKRQTTIMDGEEDDSYIITRTKFPESWLWSVMILPTCPGRNPCDTTSVTTRIPLQESITTWQFTGISLSTTHGICVGDPLEVIVRKEFFIDLMLPNSAVRGEQLEVKAILHNYSPDLVTVRVDLIEVDNVCSSASKRGQYSQEVRIGAQTTQSVPFIIIPMREGEFYIEVKAAVKASPMNDGIRKMLRVVPEGVLVKYSMMLFLDPTNKGVDGEQEHILNSRISMTDRVPNTPTHTLIFVTGREQVSALAEKAVSGNSMGTLIKQPSGNGEQNMMSMTLPVITATYLDKTNQWETVGFEKRNEALQHITTGYNQELVYRKNDGSFTAFPQRPSSTWLTAYVAKVFAMANNLVAMQSPHICEAIKFLIINAQQPDGLFREVGTVIQGEMMGDVHGADSEGSMTAFCLIAMQESRMLCAASVHNLPRSIEKAVAYLERRLPSFTNPYAVAMTSYAMANEDKMNREILYKFASPELSHWPMSKGRVYTLEATAYALLALVRAQAFGDARPVVRWFNEQQRVGGGYGSTQATIMVYQAISEYWSSAIEPEYDLNVSIVSILRTERYNFNRKNHYATRMSRINGINKNVTVIAKGSGEATLRMVSLYYTLPKDKDSDCQKFNLSVQLIPEKVDEDEKIYKLRIDVLYKDKERDAAMSILDIGLLTGFTVDTKDLDLLSKGLGRTIAKYELDKVLSERGSLIIYLDKVSHTQPEEITFRVHQKMKVGVLQPAAVSVYEYYEQTHCVQFYHPERKGGQLLRLCRGDECICAEENCSMQKKASISNDQRIAKACESIPTSKIDFVYKVKLEVFEDGLTTDIYTMRVLEVIKEGTFDLGLLNKLRTFLSHLHCRASLDLVVGKTYLIMGTSDDIHRDDAHQTFQYVLGKRTWIEYWPIEAECEADEHRPTCLGMEEMVLTLQLFGCQL